MTKAIVIYGSTTGNTESLSESVVKGLRKGGIDVMLKNVTEANVSELANYDLIVLGCSTWGTEPDQKDVEMLQPDFQDFYSEMNKISLKGKKAAVFGSGDKESYPDSFCRAVDILENKLKERGAQIVIEGLRVDGDIEPAMVDAEYWGLKIAESPQPEGILK
jgi:flavodoxin I